MFPVFRSAKIHRSRDGGLLRLREDEIAPQRRQVLMKDERGDGNDNQDGIPRRPDLDSGTGCARRSSRRCIDRRARRHPAMPRAGTRHSGVTAAAVSQRAADTMGGTSST
jgi:hypothetical protein